MIDIDWPMRGMLLAAPVALWLFCPMAAAAETYTTDGFVTLCSGAVPSEDCLVEYEIVIAANQDWGNTPEHEACPPEDMPQDKSGKYIDNDTLYAELREQVRRVLGWLKSHPQYGSQSDAEGVGIAASAVYPCK